MPVAALGEGDLDKGFGGGVANAHHFGRARGAVIERDTVAQAVELFVGQQRGGFHQISFGDVVVGVGKALAELGVVGHQQQSAGVEVQPADGGEEVGDRGDQVVDGRPAFWVFVSAEVTGGLIEQQIAELLLFEGPVVDLDFVAVGLHPEVGVLDYFAIHLHAARADPGAGVGAGA